MSKEFKSNGFSGIELTIIIAVLSIIGAVGIPAFNCVRRMAISTAAQEAIRQIKDECETNYTYGIDKFTSSNPDKYQISSSGSNSCSGGTVTLTPEDTNLYPTYLYKFADSELSYNFKGQTGTSFVACNKLICGDGKETSVGINLDFPFVVNNAVITNKCSTYVILEANNWEEAERNSQKLGGNLVTLNNIEEYSWLQKNLWGSNLLLKNKGYEKKNIDGLAMYFVGLNDVNEEGKYEWSSGQSSQWNNNEDLIHRQNWIAQQGMAGSNDYFVVHSNDCGFTDCRGDYRPDLYTGEGVGTLTWVDNESSYYKGWNSPHFGIAEIPICN